ncbi:hypothetical protein L1887_09931 [Cichorium endivia]|nr:hypothetical protein L1887_09931 [Cichorium endivia]
MVGWISGELIFVGVALSMEHLNTLNPEITIGDDDGFSMKYLGGLKVCLKFISKEDVDIFYFANDWFSEFRKGDPLEDHSERVAWLKIVGVLINLWSRENFNTIASKFGKVLIPFEASPDALELSFGRVCILTNRMKRIDEESMVVADGRLTKIGITEYDEAWSPLKSDAHCEMDEEDDSEEDEDEDGVSDTMVIENESDLEEGEIMENDDDDVMVEKTIFDIGDIVGGQSPVAAPMFSVGRNQMELIILENRNRKPRICLLE